MLGPLLGPSLSRPLLPCLRGCERHSGAAPATCASRVCADVGRSCRPAPPVSRSWGRSCARRGCRSRCARSSNECWWQRSGPGACSGASRLLVGGPWLGRVMASGARCMAPAQGRCVWRRRGPVLQRLLCGRRSACLCSAAVRAVVADVHPRAVAGGCTPGGCFIPTAGISRPDIPITSAPHQHGG